VPTCEVCGRTPAVEVTIRRHVGMIFLQKFYKLRAPLCREHGTQLLRSWTGKTLVHGWWGFISFFVNWFVLGMNAIAHSKLRALPAGAAGMYFDPYDSAHVRETFGDGTASFHESQATVAADPQQVPREERAPFGSRSVFADRAAGRASDPREQTLG
jgi:hypothetical protein